MQRDSAPVLGIAPPRCLSDCKPLSSPRFAHPVTLSSTEAEYYALTEAAKETKWNQSLLNELKYTGPDVCPTTLYRDNTRSLTLSENLEYYRRAKHIDVRQHYIRQEVANGSIKLSCVPTDQMAADGLTKTLPGPKHQAFIIATLHGRLGTQAQIRVLMAPAVFRVKIRTGL
jgi:hypothetical protein